jgi:hypothetical protein
MPRMSPCEIALSMTEERELEQERGEIYVAIFRSRASQDVLAGGPGSQQR